LFILAVLPILCAYSVIESGISKIIIFLTSKKSSPLEATSVQIRINPFLKLIFKYLLKLNYNKNILKMFLKINYKIFRNLLEINN